MSKISKESLFFLKELSQNNNREWFAENKPTYKVYESKIKQFTQ